MILMQTQLEKIKRSAEELQGPREYSKETKLRSLTKKMLLVKGRINAGDLASQTSKWAV